MGAKMLNVDRAKARLAKLPKPVQRAVEAQTEAEAHGLAEAVKRAVPVRTGTLRDTVRVEPGDHAAAFKVVIGAVPETRKKVRRGVDPGDFAVAKANGGFRGEYDYALGVEFGHRAEDGSHVPAEPFAFPTLRARRKGMARRIKAAARKTIKQNAPR